MGRNRRIDSNENIVRYKRTLRSQMYEIQQFICELLNKGVVGGVGRIISAYSDRDGRIAEWGWTFKD